MITSCVVPNGWNPPRFRFAQVVSCLYSPCSWNTPFTATVVGMVYITERVVEDDNSFSSGWEYVIERERFNNQEESVHWFIREDWLRPIQESQEAA